MARPANTLVKDLLQKKILSGGYDKTAFLPTERTLAGEYAVGRAVIRGALHALETEKILYKVPKRGWRIRPGEGKRLKKIILHLPVRMSVSAHECMGIVAGICAAANDIYAEVILSAPPVCLNGQELLERYNAGEIQGIIFLETTSELSLKTLQKMPLPCVIANLEKENPLPHVRMDYRSAGRLAGQELLRKGHKERIAVFSGNKNLFIYKELLAGFRGALAEENIYPDESWIFYAEKEEVPLALKESLRLPPEKRPRVFFTLRDYRAEILYQLCSEYSLHIPEDLQIISYDNISWPAAEKMGLSTISEDVYEIGRRSVKLLQDLYDFPGKNAENCLIQPSFIARKSLIDLVAEP